MTHETNRSESSKHTMKNPWYHAAVGAAVVAGLFSLVVFGMLAVSYVQLKVADPLTNERLEYLKIKLTEHPGDQQLVDEIRKLDLEIRQNTYHRPVFIRKASIVLLTGLLVFLISLKITQALKQTVPEVEYDSNTIEKQLRYAYLCRLLIFLLACGFVVSAFVFINEKDLEYRDADSDYPSHDEIDRNWPRFRGPGGLGISRYETIPDYWNESEKKNVLWKTKVPLPGYNSPIIWNDRIFLSGATKTAMQIYCFDLKSGSLLWTGNLPVTRQAPEVMEDTGYAAPTMVTNGKRVCVIFATGDVAGFDNKGNLIWHKVLPVPDSMYGYAASLLMYQNLVIIQYDQGMADEGRSKLIALDSFSGATAWEIKRPVGASWTSPIVVTVNQQPQIITCSDPFVIAYNPENQTEIWRSGGIGADTAASPIYAGGMVVTLSPYEQVYAIDPTGQGDVTETHIKWSSYEGLPDICSPVSDGQLIYLLQTYGTLSCMDLKTGQMIWQKDLGTQFQASPSLVGNKLYLLGAEGLSLILESGREYKELSRCYLEQGGFASPAFADGKIIVRTLDYLYCIALTD